MLISVTLFLKKNPENQPSLVLNIKENLWNINIKML